MEPEATLMPGTAPDKDPGIAGPDALFANLEKRLDALLESRLDALEARRKEAEHDALVGAFAEAHPDFRELAANGALATQQRDNPLLDDVGAYFAHHLSVQRQAAAEELAKARAEAASEAEASTLKEVRAKRLAVAMGASPAAPTRAAGPEADLSAPEKFGGINAVLAARLTARRRDAGL